MAADVIIFEVAYYAASVAVILYLIFGALSFVPWQFRRLSAYLATGLACFATIMFMLAADWLMFISWFAITGIWIAIVGPRRRRST